VQETSPTTPLAELTTLRLGGPARRLITTVEPVDVVRAVADADRRGEPVLVLAGGSNVVLPDAGFDGTVVLIRTRGVATVRDGSELVRLVAQAGETWDDLVARCGAEGLAGVECLSGIPGSVGATPIQNVGAYGQEVSETVTSVQVYDRRSGEVTDMSTVDCRFTYRSSVFKADDRYVVLAVTYALSPSLLGRAVRYAELARSLGIEVGERAPLDDVRRAVLALRRRKGMVLDPADPDTFSAGSFFTNPVLTEDELARIAELVGAVPPMFPAPGGTVKTSAAWLIERAGFGRGYGHGSVRVSSKHTLALTNRGDGTTAELLALAREIRDGVRDRLGVELVNEPVIVGDTL
jgi:UDP-N-acetylmuramate dehydrogenase